MAQMISKQTQQKSGNLFTYEVGNCQILSQHVFHYSYVEFYPFELCFQFCYSYVTDYRETLYRVHHSWYSCFVVVREIYFLCNKNVWLEIIQESLV